MTEVIDYVTAESPFWANMFNRVPVQYDDTEEYEYVEYLEANSNGAKPALNQNRFVLYNRDIDPYLLFNKGFIQVRGFICAQGTENAAPPTYFNGSDAAGQIAPCNLFNYALWDKAELRLEGSLVQKVDNPRLIGLMKHLTKYTPDNLKSQGTLSFFYKDTGDGGTSDQPVVSTVTSTHALTGRIVTETFGAGGINNYIKVGASDGTGLQVPNPATDPVDLLATGVNGSGIVLTTTNTSTSFDNTTYNSGFVARRNRCIYNGAANKKSFEFTLPLSDLFGFYENYDAPFRGLKHEITLERTQNPALYLQRDAATANGIFVFEKVSMWIPRIKPSYEKLTDLNQKFVDKAQSIMKWSDHRYEISGDISRTSLSNNLRVGSLAGRPTYCYVFFQKVSTINGNQTLNKNIFSPLTIVNNGVHTVGIAQLEMRINSHALPLQTYSLDFSTANQDYLRAYLYLLESQGKMLTNNNTGMVISYEEFRDLYPIFVFDFTRIEKRMYENISASEIEVRWKLNGATDDEYKCHIVIEHDRVAVLQAVDSKLLITL